MNTAEFVKSFSTEKIIDGFSYAMYEDLKIIVCTGKVSFGYINATTLFSDRGLCFNDWCSISYNRDIVIKYSKDVAKREGLVDTKSKLIHVEDDYLCISAPYCMTEIYYGVVGVYVHRKLFFHLRH